MTDCVVSQGSSISPTDNPSSKDDVKKPVGLQNKEWHSKEWISEEELYTEGSSDEDDMALKMKRRERVNERAKSEKQKRHSMVPQTQSSNYLPPERGAGDENVCSEQTTNEDESILWRPTQGSFNLKHHSSDIKIKASEQNGEEQLAQDSQEITLSDAYSSMHKLDALLKESDKKIKVAQAETLRTQVATRTQLQKLRDQAGAHNMVLTRNLDAFMKMCPVTLAAAGEDVKSKARESGNSILPRISRHSDEDSEDGSEGGACGELAITDEEKLRLSKLLRELEDQDDEQGYAFDEEARRCLEDIDRKLLELNALSSDTDVTASPDGVSAGATRRQRLEDIDRCLEALAASALEDVEPVAEDEVRRLLGQGEEAADPIEDPAVLADLLSEARRELPRFRFRHCGDGEGEGEGEAPAFSEE